MTSWGFLCFGGMRTACLCLEHRAVHLPSPHPLAALRCVLVLGRVLRNTVRPLFFFSLPDSVTCYQLRNSQMSTWNTRKLVSPVSFVSVQTTAQRCGRAPRPPSSRLERGYFSSGNTRSGSGAPPQGCSAAVGCCLSWAWLSSHPRVPASSAGPCLPLLGDS